MINLHRHNDKKHDFPSELFLKSSIKQRNDGKGHRMSYTSGRYIKSNSGGVQDRDILPKDVAEFHILYFFRFLILFLTI